ncbi:MAG: DUF4959 domain-containing protein [Bacteroidales bacterium]|jgi:hypothetical protein|nr:DUF4959 domain-containing protein [Bacteroidales bacterium]
MKTYIIFFIGLFLLAACSEDPIGQYPVDDTPPSPINKESVQVSNFPGGSTISYELPDETDLLYVKTKFTLPNGEVQDIRASSFTNYITVKGFAKKQQYTLQLIAVDRSQNESEPVEVTIEPEDAIIFDIVRSINYEVARGGFKMTWENAIQDEVTVTILKKNETGNFELVDAIYSSEKNAKRAVRGQDAVMTTFGVFAKDTYNNYSDTLEFSLEPLFEMQLDNKNFVAMPKLASFVLHGWSNSSMSVMWDDVLVAGSSSGQVYYIQASDINAYFTIDLGVTAQLSRFRMWGRNDYYFRLHNPRDFYIMGSNSLAVAQNAASADSEWIHLLDCESYRPSGLDSSQEATEEDYSYAAAGEEFEFPEDAPAVRYIRFRVRETWGGSNGLHVAELRFWGEPVN